MRCFVGIDLPLAIKADIVTWRDTRWPNSELCKPVPACNLHMTLLFIPELSKDAQNALSEKLDLSDVAPFTLHLNCSNHWLKPAIAWLSEQKPPPALRELHHSVSRQCNSLNIDSPDLTRSYQPHVTLLRKFKPLTTYPQPPNKWRFPVDKIHLFESRSGPNGVRYPIVQTWVLGEKDHRR